MGIRLLVLTPLGSRLTVSTAFHFPYRARALDRLAYKGLAYAVRQAAS